MIGDIDPMLDENHGKIMWCVHGPSSFPTVITCIIKRSINWYNRPIIWGYSEYRRSPGFRTLGVEVEKWAAERDAKFFDNKEAAFDYLATLITPKCDADGNKIKKKTKKQEAIEFLKRCGVEYHRTTLIGKDRDDLLAYINLAAPEPIESGNSLHWWNEVYEINGTRYELGGSISSKEPELVEKLTPIDSNR